MAMAETTSRSPSQPTEQIELPESGTGEPVHIQAPSSAYEHARQANITRVSHPWTTLPKQCHHQNMSPEERSATAVMLALPGTLDLHVVWEAVGRVGMEPNLAVFRALIHQSVRTLYQGVET